MCQINTEWKKLENLSRRRARVAYKLVRRLAPDLYGPLHVQTYRRYRPRRVNRAIGGRVRRFSDSGFWCFKALATARQVLKEERASGILLLAIIRVRVWGDIITSDSRKSYVNRVPPRVPGGLRASHMEVLSEVPPKK